MSRRCSIASCERPHTARGYCRGHYMRWWRNGDPEGGRGIPFGSVHERLELYTIKGPGCWSWRGVHHSEGYAQLKVDGRPISAHRLWWEQLNGSVPDGLELDHLCRNRGCVNPSHLEPVTHALNIQRGANARLVPIQVRAIRDRYAAGHSTLQMLADEYGVANQTISRIVLRQAWRNVA